MNLITALKLFEIVNAVQYSTVYPNLQPHNHGEHEGVGAWGRGGEVRECGSVGVWEGAE